MASSGGVRIVPEPQGQRPATARNSVDFPRPVSPTISTRSPGATLTVASSMMMCPSGRRMRTPSKARCPSGLQRALDFLGAFLNRGQCRRALRGSARPDGPPHAQSASLEKLSNEPSHSPLHLAEGARHHDQAAECQAAAEIRRRGHEDGNDRATSTLARRDPGERGRGYDIRRMVSTTAARAASRCGVVSFTPPCSAMLSPDSLTQRGRSGIPPLAHTAARHSGNQPAVQRAKSGRSRSKHRRWHTRPCNPGSRCHSLRPECDCPDRSTALRRRPRL